MISQHARYLIGLTVEAVLLAGVIAATIGILVTRRRERAQQRAFRADQRARRRAAEPVVHVGATEDWSPAAETAAVEQTPDLRTTGEQMIADHQELAGIGVAIDRFDEAVEHALHLFTSSLSGRDQLHVSRVSTTTNSDTATFNRRELDAMLAQQPELTDAEVAEIHAEALAVAR